MQLIWNIIFSATRRRRDIKIPMCLSAPVRKSLIPIVCNNHGRTHKWDFFRFQPKVPFWANLIKKNQNCQFKLKFGTYTNSNMQNSMLMFTFSVFDWNYPLWAKLVLKIKIVNLNWNLVPRLIRICRIQWCCSFFLF